MYYSNVAGMELSALGFGGLRLPCVPGEPDRIDRKRADEVVGAAIERGVNIFDTAFTYQNGDSERFLGEALSRRPRGSYYLSTKFYVAASRDIEAVFEEQLRRCRTDYFDFYLLHGLDENYIKDYMDEKEGYLAYILEQKRAGRVRAVGFSSHAGPETLRRFLDWYGGFDTALIQLNYIDWTLLEAKEQYEILTKRGIPVWVMEPLKGGRLSELNVEAAATLREAAPGRSLSSWGFRFLMGLPNVRVVFSGMSSVDQVVDNTATFEHPNPLSESESEALSQAAAIFLKCMGVPCSSCRYCVSSCPAGLDIPLLIKGYNEKNVSGETWRIAPLENAKSASECIGCGACLKRCPQKIDIPRVMRAIAEG